MLLEFSVENFRSIREATALSFVAARGRDLPENCSACSSDASLRVLKSAVLYGANASGKSNLIAAFRFMLNCVRFSGDLATQTDGIRPMPFRLDPEATTQPSRLEVIVALQEVRFVYGFSIRDHVVHEEWLHAYPHGRRRILFERSTEASGSDRSLRLHPDWDQDSKKAITGCRDSMLALSRPSLRDSPLCQELLSWFETGVRCVGAFPDLTGELDATTEMASMDPRAKAMFVDFLRLADLGISNFRVDRQPNLSGKKDTSESMGRQRITLLHEGRSATGELEELPLDSFEEESSGTQKFFALAGPWFEALERGSLLVIDELDLRLHPLLTRRLVELFHAPRTNPLCAQLLFTTHDSSLLSSDLFRRDQIWFAEKTPDGATSLYSLSDFRPQRKENIRTGYLEGRYGAIPFVGDLP